MRQVHRCLLGSAALAFVIAAGTASAQDAAPPTSPEAVFAASPPRAALTLISGPPSSVTPPATVSYSFRVTGADVDTYAFIRAGSVPVDWPAYTGLVRPTPDAELAVTEPVSILSRGSLDDGYPPECARGGGTPLDRNDLGDDLKIPAHADAVLTGRVRIPVGFAWGDVVLEVLTGALDPTPFAPSLLPSHSTEFVTRFVIHRNGRTVEGVAVTRRQARRSGTLLTGRIASGRAGVRVEIVGKPAPSGFDSSYAANQALGSQAAALSPHLRRLATTHTGSGGGFHVTVPIARPVLAVARTEPRGHRGAGASCPFVLNPRP